MPLHLYNTLTRKKEEFKPIQEGRVGIYVCGPTVYGHPHIGHAKSYVSFDVIVRYLRYLGYKVLYVQNITDVGHLTDDADEGEDKIEQKSKIEKIHPMQVAEEYTKSYFEDMDAMAVVRADIFPRAAGHIIEQIQMIENLLSKGFAYEANGNVYFDVRKFADYGKLSGRSLDEIVSGTRVESRSEKRHPADFALWKKAEPGHIMRWKSPWGEGYPGWHIECSAMSMKYLGESFDIHGGGLDNQFPHHECEIAQSVCSTQKPFAKYWLHNNLVTVNGQKMGKSLGNFVTLKDAFNKYAPAVIRFFVLQSHYRSTLDFSDEAVRASQIGYEKLINTLRNLREEIMTSSEDEGGDKSSIDLSDFRRRFIASMNDDFNTPQAIAVLFDLAHEVNTMLHNGTKLNRRVLQEIIMLMTELGGKIIGIFLEKVTLQAGVLELKFDLPPAKLQPSASLENRLITLVLSLRDEARKEKLYKLSDQIRDGLLKLGITIEDRKEGTRWRKN